MIKEPSKTSDETTLHVPWPAVLEPKVGFEPTTFRLRDGPYLFEVFISWVEVGGRGSGRCGPGTTRPAAGHHRPAGPPARRRRPPGRRCRRRSWPAPRP